jgi:hypothetical protein
MLSSWKDADQLEDGRPVAGPVASYLLAAAPSCPRLFEKRCSHWHERGTDQMSWDNACLGPLR